MAAMPDPELRDYLQHVVGRKARTTITSAVRYASWRDLPWDHNLGPPLPIPEGGAVLIGMRDMYLREPGPEAFVALPDTDATVLAAALALQIIRARTGKAQQG